MVIVVKGKDRVYVAGDVAGVSNFRCVDVKTAMNTENLPFRIPDCGKNVIVATQLCGVELDMLRCCDSFDKEVNYNTILSDIIPEFKNNLKALGQLDKYGNFFGEILIAKDNQAYIVDECVIEIDDYEVLGKKNIYHQVIYGLLGFYKDLPPVERIMKSLSDLAKMYYDCFGPVAIIDTKTMRYQFLEGGKY